jgi:hypothetical protein
MLYLCWCYCPLLILIAWCMCGIDWDEHFRRLFSLTVPPPMKILPHWLKKPSFSIRKERRLVPFPSFILKWGSCLLPFGYLFCMMHVTWPTAWCMLECSQLRFPWQVIICSFLRRVSADCPASILIQGKPKKGSCLCGRGLCLEFITILVLFYKKYF